MATHTQHRKWQEMPIETKIFDIWMTERVVMSFMRSSYLSKPTNIHVVETTHEGQHE